MAIPSQLLSLLWWVVLSISWGQYKLEDCCDLESGQDNAAFIFIEGVRFYPDTASEIIK